MSKQLTLVHDERGMTTAEYAVGIIAVITLVGVLIAIFKGGAFSDTVTTVILAIVQWIVDFVVTTPKR